MASGGLRNMLLMIGLTLLFGFTIVFMQRSLQRGTPGGIGSTFSQNTRGASALFGLAQAMGYEPERRLTPAVDELPTTVAQFWLIAPMNGLESGEGASLIAWVREGGTLIIAAKSDSNLFQTAPTSGVPAIKEGLQQFLAGWSLRTETLSSDDEQRLEPLTEYLDIYIEPPTVGTTEITALPAEPALPFHPLTEGIDDLPVFPAPSGGLGASQSEWGVGVLVPPGRGNAGGVQPLWTTEVGVIAAERVMGRGKIIVLTQPEWLSNALITSRGPLTLASRLLQERQRPGTTTFSEFHHGHRSQLRGIRHLMGNSWGRAILWLMGVLIVGLLSASTRFVAVRPAPAPSAPDPAGYARALGHLYFRAGAITNVHYNLATYFRRQAVVLGYRMRRGHHNAIALRRRAQRLDEALHQSRISDNPNARTLQALFDQEEIPPT